MYSKWYRREGLSRGLGEQQLPDCGLELVHVNEDCEGRWVGRLDEEFGNSCRIIDRRVHDQSYGD